LFLALPVLAVLGVAGCGKQGVPVQGSIVFPSGLKLANDDVVDLAFVPVEKKGGTGAAAAVNTAARTFVANIGEAKGVLPGKYTITVQILPNPKDAMKDTKALTDADHVKRAAVAAFNKIYDLTHSKLSCEVTSDPEQSFTVDLEKGTVKKN
jgi:hypothetical protein